MDQNDSNQVRQNDTFFVYFWNVVTKLTNSSYFGAFINVTMETTFGYLHQGLRVAMVRL